MGDTIACPDGRIMHSSARGGAKRDGVADDGAATAELLVPPGAPTPCLGRVVGLKRPGRRAPHRGAAGVTVVASAATGHMQPCFSALSAGNVLWALGQRTDGVLGGQAAG